MTLKIPVRILILSVLCLWACSREAQLQTENIATVRLNAPSSQVSKTWIDAGTEGKSAPVYWSAGDRISVNGVVSSPLAADPGAKLTSAEFFLRNVTLPYKVIYPHDAYAGVEGGKILIDIPATQQWKEGSFSEGSALLYGFSETEGAPVQMHNLCGAISFTVKDANEVGVRALSVTSLSEGKPITGRFALDPETMALTAEDGGSRIDMTFPDEGVKIASGGTSFFFSIPAGDYPDGFILRLDDANKHVLRRYWLRPKPGEEGVTLGAGKLVVFQPEVYDPDAREIFTAEDWQEFAAAYNAGGDGWKDEWLSKDGTIKIGADFTAESLTRIEALGDILDGCGHTITINNATTPLVKTLTGTIRNLTIAGSNKPSDSSTNGATVFVTTLNGGTVESCCSKVNFQIIETAETARAIIAGPFVRTFMAGTVENCVNEGNITLSCYIEDTDRYLLAGGIVGLVKSLSGAAVIKDCTNKGNIKVTAIKEATTGHTPLQAAYGGIVGSINDGTADKFLTMDGCVNEGDVSIDFSKTPSSPTVVAVTAAGGLVGSAMKYSGGLKFNWYSDGTNPIANMDGVYFEMKNCSTIGNVHNGLCSKVAHGDPLMDFVGGIIGIANGLKASLALIENCSVSGAVIDDDPGAYSRAAFCMVAGGLAGFGGYVHFKDCTVSGCTVGTLKKQTYASSGGIGMAPMSFKMEGCKIFADVCQIRSMSTSTPSATTIYYTEFNYSMGFTLSTKKGPEGSSKTGDGGIRQTIVDLDGSAVTGCSFGGTITVNDTFVKYDAASGFTPGTPIELTASNFKNYIACGSFSTDYYNLGIPSKVTISDNQWWDGK